ncbi:MAG: hypothetical protein N0A24_06665 [Armatimonadetes bacterium]|nr:hypothetical protein [Armatimonadota bacterium]MDW8153884.1 hypothetical protein [Armatimonadota bacterium]
MSGWIAIGRPELVDSRTVRVRIEASPGVARYFRVHGFEVAYSQPVGHAPASLLVLPAIANAAPVCWATGADLRLACVDAAFLQALEDLRDKISEFYPTLPCTTRVLAEEVEGNRIGGNEVGLLFSGGVDSTASLVRHRLENPHLVMIHGADIPLRDRRQWVRALEANRRLAVAEGLVLHTVRSNFREVLNSAELNADFSPALLGRSWWAGIQHGLALLGLLAPLSAAAGWNRVLIAATYPRHVRRPHGSHPQLDSRVRWADLAVTHDSNDLSRFEKIRDLLIPYYGSRSVKPTLRICLAPPPSGLNCGRCEKCVRTIVALLLAGADPRAYGLPYHPSALLLAQDRLLQGYYKLTAGHIPHWQELQRRIPETPPWPQPAAFFAWLRDADFADLLRISEQRQKKEREALERSPCMRWAHALRASVRKTLRGAAWRLSLRGWT